VRDTISLFFSRPARATLSLTGWWGQSREMRGSGKRKQRKTSVGSHPTTRGGRIFTIPFGGVPCPPGARSSFCDRSSGKEFAFFLPGAGNSQKISPEPRKNIRQIEGRARPDAKKPDFFPGKVRDCILGRAGLDRTTGGVVGRVFPLSPLTNGAAKASSLCPEGVLL